jgi:hypothetical protein
MFLASLNKNPIIDRILRGVVQNHMQRRLLFFTWQKPMVVKTLYTNPTMIFLGGLYLCAIGIKSLKPLGHELEVAFNHVYVGTITICT